MYEISLTIQVVDIRARRSGLEKVLRGYGIYANGRYLGKITQWERDGAWEVKFKGSDAIKRKKSLKGAIADIVNRALQETFPDKEQTVG